MPNTRPTTTQVALNDKLQRASQKCLVMDFYQGQRQIICRFVMPPDAGIKILGSMHGQLLVDQKRRWSLFLPRKSLTVHAEDQARIKQRRQNSPESMIHLFTPKFRITLQRFGYQLALGLSKKYQRRLHILYVNG